MKFYRFADKNKNTEFYKSYTLAGIKSALGLRHSWTKSNSYNLEVIEYEAKEVRRLTVNEVKQLNNKDSNNKYLELLKLMKSKENLTIEFNTDISGQILKNIDEYNQETVKRFSSLDEAIDIVSKY